MTHCMSYFVTHPPICPFSCGLSTSVAILPACCHPCLVPLGHPANSTWSNILTSVTRHISETKYLTLPVLFHRLEFSRVAFKIAHPDVLSHRVMAFCSLQTKELTHHWIRSATVLVMGIWGILQISVIYASNTFSKTHPLSLSCFDSPSQSLLLLQLSSIFPPLLSAVWPIHKGPNVTAEGKVR